LRLKELVANFINNKRWEMYSSGDEWEQLFEALQQGVDGMCKRMKKHEQTIEKKHADL